VIGRRLMIDGNAHEVIGVLQPSFQFMDREVCRSIADGRRWAILAFGGLPDSSPE
jgi:hypothetical protein